MLSKCLEPPGSGLVPALRVPWTGWEDAIPTLKFASAPLAFVFLANPGDSVLFCLKETVKCLLIILMQVIISHWFR